MTINLKEHFTKQRLLNNISLKIIALVIAVVLWFIVVGITDPIIAATYRNVQVKLVNTSLITGNEQTLEVVDDSNFLSNVVIKAPRSIIRELGNSSDNIIAIADLQNLSSDKTNIPIEFSMLKYNDKVESIKGSESSVYVNIEKKQTIQLPLVTSTTGSVESGFVVGDVTPAQNQVKVSGPASVIEQIKKAAISVEIAGFTENISTISDIILYDADGNEVSQHNLELNATSVRVNVEILATKRVPIEYEVMGTPAEGYAATGEIDCYPETLVIAGNKSEIGRVTSIKVPSSELNLTGQTGNMVALLNAADYIPSNMKLVDSLYNGRITITAYVEQLIEHTYTGYTDHENPMCNYTNEIKISYVPVGMNAEFVETEGNVEFCLVGLAKDIEKIQMSQLELRVDFSDYALSHNVDELKDGVYRLNLIMDLPEGVELKNDVKLAVKLSTATE